MTDGLSSTLALGERTNGPIPGGANAGGHSFFENAWSSAASEITDPADDHGHMVLFETQFGPNQFCADDKGLAAPHTGIAIFAICDGSVKAISENIDANVYNGLGTRNGNEVIGDFQCTCSHRHPVVCRNQSLHCGTNCCCPSVCG